MSFEVRRVVQEEEEILRMGRGRVIISSAMRKTMIYYV